MQKKNTHGTKKHRVFLYGVIVSFFLFPSLTSASEENVTSEVVTTDAAVVTLPQGSDPVVPSTPIVNDGEGDENPWDAEEGGESEAVSPVEEATPVEETSSYFIPSEKVGAKREKNPEKIIAWEEFAEPWKIFEDEGALLLNFVNADIINVLKYFESVYKVVFITDDVLQPVTPGGKSLMGSKINFTSHYPLSRKEAWNVFITILETVGVTLQPASMSRVYRIATLAKDSPHSYIRGVLPTYIGASVKDLPDCDMRIRYVYLVKNTSLAAVKSIIKTMQSNAAPDPLEIPEIGGVLMTERVYHIKTMLEIIGQVDSLTSPEAMSVIKVKRADAVKIVELHKTLIKEEGGPPPSAATLGPKRTDTVNFFDPTVRLIADPRTNVIIALGPIDSLNRIESFIHDYEESSNKLPYVPVHVHPLKFSQAETMALLLQQAIEFKSESDAAKFGGIRNGERYFSKMSIVADVSGNNLVITASDEEYARLREIIDALDSEQLQVSLNIIMLSVDVNKSKALGTQFRSLERDNPNVNFQTGVIAPGMVGNYGSAAGGSSSNTGLGRLYGNLLQLITGAAESGTTVVTFGNDAYGVGALIRILQKSAEAKVLSQPFILVNNNNSARLEMGESRRIVATTIINSNNLNQSYAQDSAQIKVDIKPQISSDGNTISMNISIENSHFISPAGDDVASGNKITRSLSTSVLIPDGSIVALGGLNYDTRSENRREVPFLARIPLIGFLFKNENKDEGKSVMLIFIEPKVLRNAEDTRYQFEKVNKRFQSTCDEMDNLDVRDPVQRWFFHDEFNERNKVNEFVDHDFRRKGLGKEEQGGGMPIVPAEVVDTRSLFNSSRKPKDA